MNNKLIQQSKNLKKEAQIVLDTLNLIPLWREAGGNPHLVGALAYDLAISPDIDMEIYCGNPKIEEGFRILNACAHKAGCLATGFRNEMAGPDQGYYWQVRFQQPKGHIWKIDMWSVRMNHPGPTSRDLITPMHKVLNEEKRQTILYLKQAILNDPDNTCPSIYLYQAILADGVRKYQDLLVWLSNHKTSGINDWRQWLPKDKLSQG